MTKQFETDLAPDARWPRLRFNFDNGWSASLIVRVSNGFDAMIASVAACPTGEWENNKTEVIENEAMADEAIELLAAIADRDPPS